MATQNEHGSTLVDSVISNGPSTEELAILLQYFAYRLGVQYEFMQKLIDDVRFQA